MARMAARLRRVWMRNWMSCETISTTGRQSIAAIEERERTRTGISSLKVRYNSVFGYYIEITKANLAAAPADYERKQTLVNAERFTTPELKEYEVKILTAHDRSIEIEKRIVAELRGLVLAAAGRIRRSSGRGCGGGSAGELRASGGGTALCAATAGGRAGAGGCGGAASGDRAVDGRDARGPIHRQRFVSGREQQRGRACYSLPGRTWAVKAPICAWPRC